MPYLATAALALWRLIGHVAVRLSDRERQHSLYQLVETVILGLFLLLHEAIDVLLCRLVICFRPYQVVAYVAMARKWHMFMTTSYGKNQ